MSYKIPILPSDIDLESKPVLKKTATARASLAEMKGVASSIPNESILINTLSLQEAKDSSAIENIITTHDELYQSETFAEQFRTIASKEVHHYARALQRGFQIVKENGFISNNHIIQLQAIVEENEAGFRKLPGTTLKNDRTGKIIYTPPQTHEEVVRLMTNLEQFVNDDTLSSWDPLVKMAVIHHQFESIHPFYDGNGRTGRILNLLYLVKVGLLDLPILYLSRYINLNKATYYQLLQKVRTDGVWEEWVLFMLEGVEQTSRQTVQMIQSIRGLMLEYKHEMRTKLPKVYSQDLLNNIFRHPYTKIAFVMEELGVSRITATRYLNALENIGLLEKETIWKDHYYINKRLFTLLSNVNI